MAKLLFKLKSVFDDEANDIKELLSSNNIDFYESPAGNWGISMHALWLNDETKFDQATQLINEYQEQRTLRVREEIQQQKDNGEFETFFQRLLNNPIKAILYIAFILFILYFSIVPFLEIGQ